MHDVIIYVVQHVVQLWCGIAYVVFHVVWYDPCCVLYHTMPISASAFFFVQSYRDCVIAMSG